MTLGFAGVKTLPAKTGGLGVNLCAIDTDNRDIYPYEKRLSGLHVVMAQSSADLNRLTIKAAGQADPADLSPPTACAKAPRSHRKQRADGLPERAWWNWQTRQI
jgi:hypothetical protein